MLQGEVHDLLVTEISDEGSGIARAGDDRFVIFVPDALPDEEVTCRIVRVKKNYALAKVLKRKNDSPIRTKPLCPIFHSCGGCQLQHLSYHAQLEIKSKAVKDALERIGGFSLETPIECLPSPEQWGYRNKASVPVQSSARNNFLYGFYKPRSHDIVQYEGCPVLIDHLDKNIKIFAEEMKNKGFSGIRGNKLNVINFIRHIVFRSGKFSGLSLSGVVGTKMPNADELKKLKKIYERTALSLQGLIYNINSSEGNFIWGDKYLTVAGDPVSHETLGRFKLSYEISSFFQVNSEQTLSLYGCVSELLGEGGNVLELYSGVGSLTLFLAEKSKNVTAVENWGPAAKYLAKNASDNGFGNIKWYSAAAEERTAAFYGEKYDTVVLDPPRTGCAPEVVASILKLAPKRIIYVSCNPATLARDLKLMASGGYALNSVRAFDMFPQTSHVETVVSLSHEKTKSYQNK